MMVPLPQHLIETVVLMLQCRPRLAQILVLAASACWVIACGPEVLKPGEPIAGELKPGETVVYRIALQEGEFLHLSLDQIELDAVLNFYDPDGNQIGAEVDYFFYGEVEELFHVATQSGIHDLSIGKYSSQGEPPDPLKFQFSYSTNLPADSDQQTVAEAFWIFTKAVNLAYTDRNCPEASPLLQQVISLANDARDLRSSILARMELGICLGKIGETERAIEMLSSALASSRQQDDLQSLTAKILTKLSLIEKQQGEFRQALSHKNEALRIFREIQYAKGETDALTDLCGLYNSMGLLKEAERHCREAISLFGSNLDLRREATARNSLAWTLRVLEREEEALAQIEMVMQLADPGSAQEAGAVLNLARVLLVLGEIDRAISSFERARSLYQKLDQQRSVVHTQISLSRALLAKGDLPRARKEIEEALEIAATLDENLTSAQALEVRSKVLATQGELSQAKADIEQAFTLIESVRPNAPDYDAKASLLAAKWKIYEQRIDLSMVPSEQEQDSAAAGLQAAEQTRARALVDTILDSQQSSGLSTRVLTPGEFQDNVLDQDTALIQFFLGTRESYLWIVTSEKIKAHHLQPKAILNHLAGELADRISKRRIPGESGDAGISNAADELGEALDLQKALSDLQVTRLVIVPDGELQRIPFSVLPLTPSDRTDGKSLIDRFEIVYAPSATALAALRQRHSQSPATRGVGIVADPVLEPSDSRLESSSLAACRESNTFPRLPQTQEEAQAIAALSRSDSQIFSGFDATKELVLSDTLSKFQYLHFATHGIIDAQNPENTGLALTCYEPSGNIVDGQLTLSDLDNLSLGADLVVLSACQTAQGEHLFGEGLMGLTRGFMNAGIPRVVASLWTVQDSVTRELMEDFYTRLLADGKKPAEALHEAQLELRKYRPEPYHWAAFVFQGEWQ